LIRKRIERLEIVLANSCREDEDQLLRFAAYDRLEHPDRMAIVHMARRSGSGENVDITAEIMAVMMRWSHLIDGLGKQDRPSRRHRGWN
jgi:hypothetical protein